MQPGNQLYSVTVRECNISGSSRHFLDVIEASGSSPFMDSLIIYNCIFWLGAKSYALYAKKAETQFNTLKITQSTFSGPAEGSNRMIAVESSDGKTISLALIDHCTFYNSNSSRAVTLTNIDGAVISNSIVMNPVAISGHEGFGVYGENSVIKNCISSNAPPHIKDVNSTQCVLRNPRFVDPSNGNFALCKNSPAVGKASDSSNIGDPRWGVSTMFYDTSKDPYIPYKLPYTMAPTKTSVKVIWQTSEEDGPTEAVVKYGTSKDNLDQSKTSDEGWSVEYEGFVHCVTLTNLKPFTRYFFTVGDKNRQYSVVSSTVTAPKPCTPFRIFSISDQHGNPQWGQMQDTIRSFKPDVAFMNGDYVTSEGNDRRWNKYFFDAGAPFLSEVPVVSSIGNHETGEPDGRRWSTYYDYFHQFSHGESIDEITDPRGEAFFHFEYGDLDVIIININGDESSPDFLPGSVQYEWADSVLAECTHPWIFICHHEGIYTTGPHGHGSSNRKKFGSLLEKYAAQGKHIISLSGDDHSFEHLFKDGVNYVRPGCGSYKTYEQDSDSDDKKYSISYYNYTCFSILDVVPEEHTIRLTAYNLNNESFYSTTFVNDKMNLSNCDSDDPSDESSESSLLSTEQLSLGGRIGQIWLAAFITIIALAIHS